MPRPIYAQDGVIRIKDGVIGCCCTGCATPETPAAFYTLTFDCPSIYDPIILELDVYPTYRAAGSQTACDDCAIDAITMTQDPDTCLWAVTIAAPLGTVVVGQDTPVEIDPSGHFSFQSGSIPAPCDTLGAGLTIS